MSGRTDAPGMLRSVIAWLLALSAFAPIALVFGVAKWSAVNSPNWSDFNGYMIVVMVSLLFCLLPGVVLRAVAGQSSIGPDPILVEEVKPADRDVLGFVVAYMLPAVQSVTASFEPYSAVVAAAIGVAVLKQSDTFHVNPLLGFLGYRFYEVKVSSGATYLLVSEHPIMLEVRKQGERWQRPRNAIRLTPYTYLDRGPKDD